MIRRYKSHIGSLRINFFLLIIIASAGIIGYRLFSLTIVEHTSLASSAQRQHIRPSERLQTRGNIFVSDISTGKDTIAASNGRSYYVFANPSKLSSPVETAYEISQLLGTDRQAIEDSIIDQNKKYVVIEEGLSKNASSNVSALKIEGIDVGASVERVYANYSPAHVTGFVGYSGDNRVGQYGIESYFDDILSGQDRTLKAAGNSSYASIIKYFSSLIKRGDDEITDDNEEKVGDVDGDDVVLTIDKNIQQFIEGKLNENIKKWSASGGTIIIQDPETGAILGMASSPSYDPNRYSDFNYKYFANPSIQDIFEPGSSFKGITMAAALDTGSVKPHSTFNDKGSINVAGHTIRNAIDKQYGTTTMRQVLERSLNTGSIYAEQKTGNDNFLKYVVSFGFGQKTDVDLSSELSGNINNLYGGRAINFATASFGQGIAVTPLQLINAYSAIANGGKLMRPYVVREILHKDGNSDVTESKILDVPISEATSRILIGMLASVVENGLKNAQVVGYDLAAKTGTAQIPNKTGGYQSDDQVIHNIVGFVPAYQPVASILIKLDRPKGVKFSSDTLSEPFADVSRYLLRYFNVAPNRR